MPVGDQVVLAARTHTVDRRRSGPRPAARPAVPRAAAARHRLGPVPQTPPGRHTAAADLFSRNIRSRGWQPRVCGDSWMRFPGTVAAARSAAAGPAVTTVTDTRGRASP